MSGHTPGPWEIGYGGAYVGCRNEKIGGFAKLFDVRGWGYLTGNGHGALGLNGDKAAEIQFANARLAASAPELLEACKAVIAEHREGYGLACLDQVNAAIAKAEG